MLTTFIVGFVFSFLGSIPPGSINLSVIQLSLDNQVRAALRFALAAAIIEFPYAFIAVQFEGLITSSPWIVDNFRLLTAIVMLTLGMVNIITHTKTKTHKIQQELKKSGFRKGVLISILNPLAIPFWIGVTAYLNHQQWIDLPHIRWTLIYVLGISAGTFALLALLALLAHRLGSLARENRLVNLVPGMIFIILGLYALGQYFNLT